MSDITNLRDTIVPKSDQLNAEQLLAGPMTITITNVRRGDGEQPIVINYANDSGRPYKPCKTMRKVLIFAWGEDGSKWVGKSMTLFNDPNVKFGGVAVGGIRISHMTDIGDGLKLSLTATRGKKDPFIIQPLAAQEIIDQTKVQRFRQSFESNVSKGLAALREGWAKVSPAMRTALGAEWYDQLERAAHDADVARMTVQQVDAAPAAAVAKDDPF